MATADGDPSATAGAGDEARDAWSLAQALLRTLDRFELVDPAVGSERLLYRLFHEPGVRVFESMPLADRCRCSRERASAIVRTFSDDEIEEFTAESGQILVHCEFCSTEYAFQPEELREAPEVGPTAG
jgi:molecular chaperone Hsp33